MGLRFEATAVIDAGPEVVWRVLSDLRAYREWNPYIVDARGSLEPGEPVELKISPPDTPTFTIETQVNAVTPAEHLALGWQSDDPDLFSGEAVFDINPTPFGAQVTFRQTVEGVPGLKKGLGDRNDLALEMMLAALKARCERQSRH